MITISLILTVLNEGESLPALLDSLTQQTRPPGQLIVVDGGSQDNTLPILHRYRARLPLRIIEAPWRQHQPGAQPGYCRRPRRHHRGNRCRGTLAARLAGAPHRAAAGG
ncbi:MAG: glycosyltransferase [Anaerolineae bacterium]|nr:glycosyltransferase [Anaerolineae bacterium]